MQRFRALSFFGGLRKKKEKERSKFIYSLTPTYPFSLPLPPAAPSPPFAYLKYVSAPLQEAPPSLLKSIYINGAGGGECKEGGGEVMCYGE